MDVLLHPETICAVRGIGVLELETDTIPAATAVEYEFRAAGPDEVALLFRLTVVDLVPGEAWFSVVSSQHHTGTYSTYIVENVVPVALVAPDQGSPTRFVLGNDGAAAITVTFQWWRIPAGRWAEVQALLGAV